VPPDADQATIRTAYRRLARLHHPDQSAAGGAGHDDREMAAINEAYRVLADPGRRAMYDRGGAPATPAPTPRTAHGVDDVRWRPTPDLPPARMPWRLMGGIVAVGSVVVLLGAIFAEPPQDAPPDGLLRTGSCVAIEPNGDAREVACTGEGDLVVEQLVPIDARCPGGTEPHRDRQGLGTACVVVATGEP
jgi:hypothetical protein